MNRLDFNAGLEAACRYLIGTAEDLEQRLPERKERNAFAQGAHHLGWAAEAAAIKNDEAKARLLRGQVINIRKELSK